MRLLVIILMLFFAWGCAARIADNPTVGKPTKDPDCPDYSDTVPGYYGGDGSSENQAVETVRVEYTSYRWIEERYPGARVTLQALVVSPITQRKYDVMTFTTVEGKTMKAWFWISGGLACLMK
jgi:hypothetical protein